MRPTKQHLQTPPDTLTAEPQTLPAEPLDPDEFAEISVAANNYKLNSISRFTYKG
ncbi:hypothetical protein BLL52_1640 [Rhodoferax antarcticus ANT.BR]|uniref:Uncharacterized protein n=1 Tax=Rhodoferax antarcticus ANT.BR TaxID=1111071 RepID=A0A1Q8YFR9_9BURK|nr:hypothetical protein BLL52_1640 [Rhodoferax antarcticus ANT.BR]